jgi:periplasmic protein TonB
MFHNLIESSSHTQELKRRGSFVLFTTATYVLLFAITGAVSIYAYDARLEDQGFDIVINMLPPMEVNAAPAINRFERPRSDNNNKSAILKAPIVMTSLHDPKGLPEGISVKANPNPPLPDIRSGGKDLGGGVGSPDGNGPASGGSLIGSAPPNQAVVVGDSPPVPEIPKPQPRVISKGIITGQATFLPKPAYPPIAKRLGIQGTVSVQVLVDETGRVISARALAGSPFLISEAQRAALEARFSPALLSGQPVKVSGVITYNFVMQ